MGANKLQIALMQSVGSPCLTQDCLWHSQGMQLKETRQKHHAALFILTITRHNQQVTQPSLQHVLDPLV